RQPCRQGVDEQTDHLLGARQFGGTSRHDDAEGHLPLAARAGEEQRPCPLDEGVLCELVPAAEGTELRCQPSAKAAIAPRIAQTVAGGAVPGPVGCRQRRWGSEAGESLTPEGLGPFSVLTAEPGHVVPEFADRGGPPMLSPLQRGVSAEAFLEDQGEAPAVKENLQEAPDELMDAVALPRQKKARQRKLGDRKTALTLGFDRSREPLLLRRFRQLLPVLDREGEGNTLLHHLERLGEPLPMERRAQRRVVVDHALPGKAECFDVEHAVQLTGELPAVETGPRLVQEVEEHAFLERRQRIDVGDRRAAGDQAVELWRGETGPRGKREVGRGETAGLAGAAGGNQAPQSPDHPLAQGLDRRLPVEARAVGP